jgi:2-polyprenyl-3-methyl-5-hydroxy-6-metoxy-1,4-benzoquinol methylase
VTPVFTPVRECWICGAATLTRVHDASFELGEYRTQDPELAAYSGQSVPIVRCAACGFAQPLRLPALARYFERLYDQRWSRDWIAREHDGTYKDLIFAEVIRQLEAKVRKPERRLLDIGSHAGRFLVLARRAGWNVEGLELNPSTAAFAAAICGARIHHASIHAFEPDGERFDAITMTDVLEHVPEPRLILRKARTLLVSGGWLAIKVPNAPAQRLKERARARLRPAYRATLADNLVHVSHFSPASLRAALAREGFEDIAISAGAPELPPNGTVAARADRALRLGTFRAARVLPGGIHTPMALNLQAYARRP